MSETDRKSNFVTNLKVNETIKQHLLEQLKNKKRGLNRKLKRLQTTPKSHRFINQVMIHIYHLNCNL